MSNLYKVQLYTSPKGEFTVRNEIERLNKRDIPKVLRLISRLETYGQRLGGDYVKHVKDKIWELREDRYRILYFAYIRDTFILLRVFMKKSRKTPLKEITIAEKRLNDFLFRFPK